MFRKTNLCGDDVKLELLPVVVSLFESLNLASSVKSLHFDEEVGK